MKKNSLFKVILIVLGLLVTVDGILAILGYWVPGLEGKYTMIPLGDLIINFVQSFYYFFDTIVFLLVLGAFYGVLKEVPAYKKLVDNIAQKVKSHSKLFVFIVTGLFALLTSKFNFKFSSVNSLISSKVFIILSHTLDNIGVLSIIILAYLDSFK